MLNSPITITAIEGMPLSSGTAAAIAVTCKQIGNSLGWRYQVFNYKAYY